jgi:maltose O-acetyltransferase
MISLISIKKIYIKYYALNLKANGLFWSPFVKVAGKNLRISSNCMLINPSNISFGNNVFLNHHVNLDATMGTISIGDDVSVGFNSSFITANHDINSKKLNEKLIGDNIIVEKNVWIGAHCIILPGVKIKTGSVIAAGAVVTKNVESNTIVGGIPAKFIKSRNKLI